MSGLDALHQLAASASEVHAAIQRPGPKQNGKPRADSEEERARKRQMRLLKNRQSAALSRQRKKEYINNLEVKAGDLGTDKSDLEYKVTKLTSMTLEYKLQVDRLEKQLHDTAQENTELRLKLSALENAPQGHLSVSSSASSMRLLHPIPMHNMPAHSSSNPFSTNTSSSSQPSYVPVQAYPPPVPE